MMGSHCQQQTKHMNVHQHNPSRNLSSCKNNASSPQPNKLDFPMFHKSHPTINQVHLPNEVDIPELLDRLDVSGDAPRTASHFCFEDERRAAALADGKGATNCLRTPSRAGGAAPFHVQTFNIAPLHGRCFRDSTSFHSMPSPGVFCFYKPAVAWEMRRHPSGRVASHASCVRLLAGDHAILSDQD